MESGNLPHLAGLCGTPPLLANNMDHPNKSAGDGVKASRGGDSADPVVMTHWRGTPTLGPSSQGEAGAAQFCGLEKRFNSSGAGSADPISLFAAGKKGSNAIQGVVRW